MSEEGGIIGALCGSSRFVKSECFLGAHRSSICSSMLFFELASLVWPKYAWPLILQIEQVIYRFRRAEAFGANGCCGTSGQAGCCNTCCDDSFNEDSFDRDKPQNDQKPVDSQPPAAENMIAPITQDKPTTEPWQRIGQGPHYNFM